MNISQLPHADSVISPQGSSPMSLTEIEQTIAGIGARYVDDLRVLSEMLSRFYDVQLVTKEHQITELLQRTEAAERERDDAGQRIAELLQRTEAAERERDAAVAQTREIRQASARYVDHLRAIGEELAQRVERVEYDGGVGNAQERSA